MRGNSTLPDGVLAWLRHRGIPPVLFYYIAVNVGVFLIVGVFRVFQTLLLRDDLLADFSTFFSLPASLSRLFASPWTIVTYMFYHEGFTHILFNMLWLWVFGRLFFLHATTKDFHRVYCWGGIAGGLFYVVAYNLFPYFASVLPMAIAMGASASVMAITVAAVVKAPREEVYLFGLLRVQVLWIAVGVVLLDFFSVTGANAGGHIAHLGGAFFGFLYARYGMRVGGRRSVSIWERLSLWWTTLKRQSKKKESPQSEQKEVERILAKLAKGGYAALSTEEKEKLFRPRS